MGPPYVNDYCLSRIDHEACYKLSEVNGDGYDVTLYITGKGIGVDVDLECGGPFQSHYYSFSDYPTFADAYNDSIEHLQ